MEEVTKQLAYFEEHGDFRPDQTTVLWDEALKQTKVMRKKEFAADYRFAHEPDIPFVNIKAALEQLHVDENLLPFAIETAQIKGGVRPQDAKFFTSDAARSGVYTAINNTIQDPLFVAKTLLNNLKPEAYASVTNTVALTCLLYTSDAADE